MDWRQVSSFNTVSAANFHLIGWDGEGKRRSVFRSGSRLLQIEADRWNQTGCWRLNKWYNGPGIFEAWPMCQPTNSSSYRRQAIHAKGKKKTKKREPSGYRLLLSFPGVHFCCSSRASTARRRSLLNNEGLQPSQQLRCHRLYPVSSLSLSLYFPLLALPPSCDRREVWCRFLGSVFIVIHFSRRVFWFLVRWCLDGIRGETACTFGPVGLCLWVPWFSYFAGCYRREWRMCPLRH